MRTREDIRNFWLVAVLAGAITAVGLGAARQKAAEARQLLTTGVDPSQVRQQKKQSFVKQRQIEQLVEAGLPVPESFEAVAREWFGKHAPTWADSHSDKIIRRLERDVFPWIGSRPITSIAPKDLLELLRRVEGRGAIETTHRVQQNCGQVFRYAVATGLLGSDPSRDLRGALPPRPVQQMLQHRHQQSVEHRRGEHAVRIFLAAQAPQQALGLQDVAGHRVDG